MSLATKQRIVQAQSDHDDLLRRLSVGEDTPRVQQLLAQAKNTIARFQKQFEDEKASAKVSAKATETKKERRHDHRRDDSRGLPADMELACVDCASHFPFTGKDQLFYTKNHYPAPIRCTICREAKKNAKPPGKDIECCGCNKKFFFSDAKASIFEEKGWPLPKWCPPCKASRSHKTSAGEKVD